MKRLFALSLTSLTFWALIFTVVAPIFLYINSDFENEDFTSNVYLDSEEIDKVEMPLERAECCLKYSAEESETVNDNQTNFNEKANFPSASTSMPPPVFRPITPTETINFASILSGWNLNYSTGPQIIHLDYNVAFNGEPSIRLDRHVPGVDNNKDREVNSVWIPIKPGDRIIFSAWIKISESGYGDTNPFSGARIGLDFYAEKRIAGHHSANYPDTIEGIQSKYVQWGTSGWVKNTIDIVVPQYVLADGYLGYPEGTPITPTGIILWMQVWSSTYGSTDPGQAWFASPELYINP